MRYPNLTSRPASDASSAQLRVKQDDFSVQVESSQDTMFWIRVERSGAGIVRVSDLKRSTLSTKEAAEALNLAIATAFPNSQVTKLTFLDVAPSRGAEAAKLEAAHIAKIIVQFATTRGLRVEGISLVSQNHKTNVDINLQ